MSVSANRNETLAPIQTGLGAIFVSLELSRSEWLVTSGWKERPRAVAEPLTAQTGYAYSDLATRPVNKAISRGPPGIRLIRFGMILWRPSSGSELD